MTMSTGEKRGAGPTASVLDRPAGPAPTQGPLAAARALHDELGRRADTAEKLRDLPDDTVRALRSARLFSLALPRELGGWEAPPRDIIATIEVLSYADPSVGWSVLIGQGSGFLAWLAPEVAAEIVAGTPDPIVASSFAPLPPTPCRVDTYRLTGQWPYCSGIRHADWIMGAFLAAAPQGPPAMRFGFVPAADWTVIDTWNTVGLAATGSNNVLVNGAAVPSRRTADPRTEVAHLSGQLYRLPLFSLLMVCMAGFPLGVARRALDEIAEIAVRKSRSSSRAPLADDPVVQTELVLAEAAYQAARAGVLHAVDELWSAAADHSDIELAVRARFAASVQHAMRTAVDVVDTSFRLAGGGAIYRGGQLQRCWRDIQVAASHIVFGPDSVRRLGRAFLGRDVPAELF